MPYHLECDILCFIVTLELDAVNAMRPARRAL